jgi:ADP-ribose pyrophosphatase YjhB (NUDIX family)/GNAT superfamily N-acetyltransferase
VEFLKLSLLFVPPLGGGMEISMELWDLYDNKKQLIGLTHERGVPLGEGHYHLVVEIITVNNKHQILLTKRDDKKPFGGMWECSGGSVIAGEDSLTGAKRELFEETGIIITDNMIQMMDTVINDSKHTIYDIYLAISNTNTDELVMQEGETVEAKWVTLAEIEDMEKTSIIVPNVYQFITKNKGRIKLGMQSVRLVEYDNKFKDDLILMIIEAKSVLGNNSRLNKDLLDINTNYINNGDKFWLALNEEDRVIGCLGTRTINSHEMWLKRFYIKTNRKRRGIGTQLLKLAEVFARERGVTDLYTRFNEKYSGANPFYASRGFVDDSLYVMKKHIGS